MLRWPGEWLNGSGWPSAITTAGIVLQNLLWKHLILRGQDMPTWLQLKCCIFCSRVPSFLMCSLSLIMLSAPSSDNTECRLNNRSLNTGLLVLDFQLCVLRLVRWVRCGDYHPWNVRLNVCPGVLLWTMWTLRCLTFSTLNFLCHGVFVVWKTK